MVSSTSWNEGSQISGQIDFQEKYLPKYGGGNQFSKKYHINKIVLKVKNPEWAYVYWEYTPDKLQEITYQAGYEETDEARLILRVYDTTPKKEIDFYDISITQEHDSWYISDLEPNHSYKVKLGILDDELQFNSMLKSNEIHTPPNDISDIATEELMRVNEKLKRIYMLSGIDNSSKYSSAEFMKKIKERIQESSLRTGYSSFGG
ncbi:DUF4912 domain-containing protein [Selenihalanaerobacter shriftii]|uniref:DUF4912 domain-containing protein n=1 Tax=Selenihalanaerobacter shriftii TaxID=142842 RepID=A0A1T4K3M4_9FIRM|nr:DUF4912 domain-containing protein [Selenihalanaerobacter shriftii]SJZ36897.1 hypothetical protein SAMN02745118_00581 [Selenihalanaerobacter shriftii]